jgi:hypothetical protein
MLIPAPVHLPADFRRLTGWLSGIMALALLLSACQPQHEQATAAATPPVGHYEGSLGAAEQAETRAALDIRHPSPGHYEAELTVNGASTLSFVADTIIFSNNQLRLTRPARPNEVLTLTLDGDFWRGTLTLDSVKRTAILVKRGMPTPSTYRVEELPQAEGAAWLFAPADTGTPGTALALLPTKQTVSTAAVWADALAREGIIVLLLPALDSTTAAAEAPRLAMAMRFLHSTAGADTANIGAWAVGARAAALAQHLVAPTGRGPAFLIAQNADLDPAGRAAFRELRQRKFPILGLYGGTNASSHGAALKQVLGGRRGTSVRIYRNTGPDLLVADGPSLRFGPGLPADVVEWLQGK